MSHIHRCITTTSSSLTGLVVLLDEADVFLEQRTSKNLERNALVSGRRYPSTPPTLLAN